MRDGMIAAICLLAPTLLGAQTYALRGQIIDEQSLVLLPQVRLVVTAGHDTLGTGTADSTGRFVITLKRGGPVMLHLVRFGYRTDSVAMLIHGGDPELANVALEPKANVQLAAMAANSREMLSGFEARARRGATGVFFRREDVERIRPARTSDLLQRVTGLTVSDSDGVTLIVGRRSGSLGQRTSQALRTTRTVSAPTDTNTMEAEARRQGPSGSCIMRIVVDGRPMEDSFSVNQVADSDIEGIEVYRGPSSIPVEYSAARGNAACGLIMIWRRTGDGRE